MSEFLKAPFTSEQVTNLNVWQTDPNRHPFTCGHCRDAGLPGECPLTATEGGWICPTCDYTQNWAHDFMAEHSEHRSWPW